MVAESKKQSKWKSASAKQPCPVCKNDGWCSVSRDGCVVLCRRVPSNNEKRDKSGTRYWVHRVDADATHDRPRLYVHEEASSEPVTRADVDVLDRVYQTLLKHVALSPEHREGLMKRG